MIIQGANRNVFFSETAVVVNDNFIMYLIQNDIMRMPYFADIEETIPLPHDNFASFFDEFQASF